MLLTSSVAGNMYRTIREGIQKKVNVAGGTGELLERGKYKYEVGRKREGPMRLYDTRGGRSEGTEMVRRVLNISTFEGYLSLSRPEGLARAGPQVA